MVDDPAIPLKDREKLGEFYDAITGKKVLPTGYLSFRFMLTKYLNRRVLGPEELMAVIRFLGKEPLTGFNTLNKLMRAIKCSEFDPTHRYLKFVSGIVLHRQLRIMFNQLRREDVLLSAEDISELPSNILDKICFDRGIDIEQSQREKIEDLRLWQSISNLRNVPNTLLIITRVQDFGGEEFYTDEAAKKDDYLRQVTILLSLSLIHFGCRKSWQTKDLSKLSDLKWLSVSNVSTTLTHDFFRTGR